VDTFEGFRWASILGIIGSVSNTTRTASPSCPRLSTASAQRSHERPGTSYSGPRKEVPGLTSQEVSITG
jgi:hypothetical protein